MKPSNPVLPVPVQEISEPFIEEKGVRLIIKREDLIHSEISGNKWWKLRYNLEEARRLSKDTLLTFGGAYSNHIAATAAAGRIYGFRTIGIIRGEETRPLNPTLEKARDDGMEIRYVSRERYRQKSGKEFISQLCEQSGDFYLIPEGGANPLAVKGCMEMMENITEPFDYVCCPCGTGSTLAGIILSLKAGQKAMGFPALRGGAFLEQEVKRFVEDYAGTSNRINSFHIHPGYHFGGYAKTTPELYSFIRNFKHRHGIPLDPVYTGKMVYGVLDLIRKNFFEGGSTILMIHTGGLQGCS